MNLSELKSVTVLLFARFADKMQSKWIIVIATVEEWSCDRRSDRRGTLEYSSCSGLVWIQKLILP